MLFHSFIKLLLIVLVGCQLLAQRMSERERVQQCGAFIAGARVTTVVLWACSLFCCLLRTCLFLAFVHSCSVYNAIRCRDGSCNVSVACLVILSVISVSSFLLCVICILHRYVCIPFMLFHVLFMIFHNTLCSQHETTRQIMKLYDKV
jgi:hypothetical protein